MPKRSLEARGDGPAKIEKDAEKCVIGILEMLKTGKPSQLKSAISRLEGLFLGLLSELSGPTSRVYLKPEEVVNEASLTVEEKYGHRLRKQYSLGLDALQKLMLHSSEDVVSAATEALCRIVKAETVARSRPKKRSAKSSQSQARLYQFAVFSHRRIVLSLLDDTVCNTRALTSVTEYLELDDFRFSTLKTMEMLVREKAEGKGVGQCFVTNCFAILKAIAMPKMQSQVENFIVDMEEAAAAEPAKKKSKGMPKSEEKEKKEFYGDPAGLAAHRRVFSSAWLAFLRLPLPTSVLVRVLNNIHTNVMPHMVNPKLLIDFLADAYDAGGAVSLLALNGLFLLINKYNLDYPDFYEKLYALLQPSIFYQKYCNRFFRLANLFLSSSHLPAYLIAAFAKRLSRLSLAATPSGCMIAVVMITNLLKRHPSCKVLIHRRIDTCIMGEDGEFLAVPETSLDSDPFLAAVVDPAKCRALDSCLWELECLRNHYLPAVSTSLGLLSGVNDMVEVNLEPYLEHTYDTLQDDFESADACLAPSSEESKVEPIVSLP